MQNTHKILSALANENRMRVLDWLKAPSKNFPPQVLGNLEKDGVCSIYISEKLGISPPTASRHLRILEDAGLVKTKRIKQFTFYLRNEPNIKKAKKLISQKI